MPSTVLGPRDPGASRITTICTFMKLGAQSVYVSFGLHVKNSKTKHAVNILKLGYFTQISRFLASL